MSFNKTDDGRLTLVATHKTLPIKLVWGTAVFYLCGGGNYAQEMMISVMIAAACSDADRLALTSVDSSRISAEVGKNPSVLLRLFMLHTHGTCGPSYRFLDCRHFFMDPNWDRNLFALLLFSGSVCYARKQCKDLKAFRTSTKGFPAVRNQCDCIKQRK